MFACVCACVSIGHTSSLPSITLRTQSSPGGADSHFSIPTEDGEGNFYLFLNSLGAQLTE